LCNPAPFHHREVGLGVVHSFAGEELIWDIGSLWNADVDCFCFKEKLKNAKKVDPETTNTHLSGEGNNMLENSQKEIVGNRFLYS
jgi:hypothetical protein